MPPQDASFDQEEFTDFRDIFRRIGRGLGQTFGLALLGLSVASIAYLAAARTSFVTTSTRVAFFFPGSGKGQYPDDSKFAPSDITAPDVIAEALKRAQLDHSSAFQSDIHTALTVEAIVPLEVVKARDKMIAAGQTPPPYSPNEYSLILTLPRTFPLSNRQREILLDGLIAAYRDKFQRTYASIPRAFGNLHETLSHADFDDYERILSVEGQSINAYLIQLTSEAPSFRSSSTNLSFNDLLKESQLFSQVYLNETLGLIRLSSLSRDRKTALLKMDYQLQTLGDQEHQAMQEEQLTRELLTRAEGHNDSHVLGVKSQAGQSSGGGTILDQGLVDSLLANDTYNFMMRKALDAGLKVKDIQSEKDRIMLRRKQMELAMFGGKEDESMLVKKTETSMKALDTAYERLIADIRNTYADYSKQEFADAIRLSAGITTDSMLMPLIKASAVGLFIGAAVGMGLSLLEIYIGGKRKTVGQA